MKIITKITMLLAFSAVAVSCKLDLKPTTEIEKGQAFETYADAQRFANGLSSSYRNTLYGVCSYTSEVQGDMYNASTQYGNRNGFPHTMGSGFTTGDYNTRDVWRTLYKGITNVNNFLENVDKIETDVAKEQAAIAKWKGEAYFYRAAMYHQLVLKFAVAYRSATATSDLGMPLLTKFDVAEKPARATMAETYKFINDDIAQARTLLAGVAGQVRAITPTIDAVNALDARVKLYMGDYPAAAQLAGDLTASSAYTLASDAETMDAEWEFDNGSEDILQLYADLTEYGSCLQGSGSEDTRLANDIYLGYSSGGDYYQGDFIPTKTCLDMYDQANDLRFARYFALVNVDYGGVKTNLYLLNKYPGNPKLFTPPTRNYAQKAKAFTVAEMYLIQAEAALLAGDAGTATTALNALQTARGAAPTAATMDNIKKEWAKETLGEGMRVDCLKRWGDGFSGRIPQNAEMVMKGADFIGADIKPTYFKLTWPIPADDINTNHNIKPNPGW